jgi:hypothetical protein
VKKHYRISNPINKKKSVYHIKKEKQLILK